MSWGFVALGVGTIGAAYISSEGSEDAAEIGAAATEQATGTELQMFREAMALQEPWRQAGEGALGYLSNYLGVGGPRTLPRPTREGFYSPVDETRPAPTYDDVLNEVIAQHPDVDPTHGDTRYWVNKDYQNRLRAWEEEQKGARTFDEEGYQNALANWEQQNQQFQEQYGSFGGISPEDYEKSPYYDFLQQEGVNALTNQASGRGRVLSGAQGKALQEYGQNLASTDYQNWLNRKYQSLAPYQSLAGVGQTTATQMGQQTQGAGTSLANNALYAGNLQAQNQMNQANIWGGAMSNLTGLGANYAFGRSMGYI